MQPSVETTAVVAKYASRNALLRLGEPGQCTGTVEVLAARTAWLYIALSASKQTLRGEFLNLSRVTDLVLATSIFVTEVKSTANSQIFSQFVLSYCSSTA